MTLAVSDHAVLRYLERVHGIDVAGIRHLIRAATRDAAATVAARGLPGRYAVRTATATYVIEDDTVVTVLAAGMTGRIRPGGGRGGS